MDSPASTLLIDDICSPDPARVSAALQAAAPLRETLAPVLLARLLEASIRPADWTGAKGRPSPVFLFYLAAAWRETGAHTLLAALLRLPAKQCDKVLGDFITEGARLVLADTWPGDLRTIDAIVFDASAEPFARGAAVNAAVLLAARGRLSRANVLAFLGRVAAIRFDPAREDDVTVATELVGAAMDLRAWELRGTVIGLFKRELVDESMVGDFDEVLAELEPGAVFDPESYHFPPPITDAWEKVRSWCFFDSLHPGRRQWFAPEPATESADSPPLALDLTPPEAIAEPFVLSQPYIAPPKPGRNDPCPCGSGRKYKKCCGA